MNSALSPPCAIRAFSVAIREEEVERRGMAGGRTLSSSPSDLLHRIKSFVQSLVDDLGNDRPPSVALDRYRNYCSDLSGRWSSSIPSRLFHFRSFCGLF
ncbi:hypothetical protein ZIOFF_064480 [Zingiber officinale]|uniref:Uncharacterized protein n=1 Tax=Zingiber officinale TaxID=94328 RepID=A0A8J5KGD8_ZINOF|nr:hypothetical protein ZIOFF_064480 [Zingiber officinale]